MNDSSPTEAGPTEPHSTPPIPAWKKCAQKVQNKLHWIAPNTIPSPYWDGKEFHQHRDIEVNIETRIPESESVRTIAVWGMELFGPSEIDRLYNALNRLGWAGPLSNDEGGLTSAVMKHRAYSHFGGWQNIGIIVRRGEENFINRGNSASLPSEVKHVFAMIRHISPSLTCVQLCFVLHDDAQKIYENALNTDKKTRYRRNLRPRSVSILGPEHLKQEEVDLARARFKKMICVWFRSNMPGFFASRNDPDRFPTGELVKTINESLFTEKALAEKSKHVLIPWNKIISNVLEHDIWTCSELPSLQLSLTSSHSRRDGNIVHFTATVCESNIPDDAFRLYQSKTDSSIIAICKNHIDGIFSYLATIQYLSESSSDLKRARESLNLSNLKRKSAMKLIKEIQSHFDSTVGLPVTALELSTLSENDQLIRYDCSSFTSPAYRNDQADRNLIDEICAGTKFRSKEVLQREAATREHMEQLSTVISIRESVKAQRNILALTVAAVTIATASLVVSIPHQWIDNFKHGVAFIVSAL